MPGFHWVEFAFCGIYLIGIILLLVVARFLLIATVRIVRREWDRAGPPPPSN